MTNTKEKTVHVITSVERRWRWSAFEKKAIVEESFEVGNTVSSVARKYDLSPSQVLRGGGRWRKGLWWGLALKKGYSQRVRTNKLLSALKGLKGCLGKRQRKCKF